MDDSQNRKNLRSHREMIGGSKSLTVETAAVERDKSLLLSPFSWGIQG
jgi:hypothetical protein